MRTVIKLEHVSKKFSEEQVLRDVCFEFQEGKIYGIVGNNGSGKTVLMKCICGFLNPSSGKILVNSPKDRSVYRKLYDLQSQIAKTSTTFMIIN